jgi:hypothetical protein
MCNVQALLTNGILLLGEDMEVAEESLTAQFVSPLPSLTFGQNTVLEYRQRKEYKAFQQLLRMVPRLNERLMEGSEEECIMVADFVRLPNDELLNSVSFTQASKGYI